MTPGGAGPRVLIVDDEAQIRRFLRASLAGHGYDVREASSGEAALREAIASRPDVIVLDLGLPGIDGLETTRRLREWSSVPIIILSVRGEEEAKIAALDLGADDYLTKPFGVGELLARIRVALRHAAKTADDPLFRCGDLVVDVARRIVTVSDREVKLTPTEYEILRVLVRNAGKVVTHQHLLREVWGPAYGGDTHLLRVNVGNLRHKIEPDPARPRYIVTEPAVGYRLRAEP